MKDRREVHETKENGDERKDLDSTVIRPIFFGDFTVDCRAVRETDGDQRVKFVW